MGALLRIAIVADDVSVLGGGLRAGLPAPDMIDIVYSGPAQQAFAALRQAAVDAVVLGPARDVEERDRLRDEVRQRLPSVRLLLATSSEASSPVMEALDAGITGVILVPTTPQIFVAALETVVRGGFWVDGGISDSVLKDLRSTLSLQLELKNDQEFRARLKELLRRLTELASLPSVDEMLPAVTELARHITHAEYAAMAVLDDRERIAAFITVGLTDEQRRQIGSLPHGRGLLGEVIHTRRPLRVPSIQAHPSSSGWPAGHPAMESFLGMPMLFQDSVVGHLYCTNHRDGAFTRDDEEILGFLARHAAVLIHTARLTQELQGAILAEERQRISMDLHDGTLQAVYGVILGLDTLMARDLADLDVHTVLEDVADRLTGIIQSIRGTVQNLRQHEPDLLRALQAMIDDLSASDVVRLQSADAHYRRLDPDQADQVLGWAREAVSNAIRHSGAAHIDVTWHGGHDHFFLVVTDDGQGFDVAAAQRTGHFGLVHLRERAERLGGQVSFESAPGQGTRVTLTAPFSRPHEAVANGASAPVAP